MKRFSLFSVIMCFLLPGQVLASDLTIGFSWNSVTQPLERAWEDYMRSEAEVQGKAAGVNIKWVFHKNFTYFTYFLFGLFSILFRRFEGQP